MNYFEQLVIPESPRVLSKEQLSVYIPIAGTKTPGIAKYNPLQFTVNNGEVRINREYLRLLFDEYSDFEKYVDTVKKDLDKAKEYSDAAVSSAKIASNASTSAKNSENNSKFWYEKAYDSAEISISNSEKTGVDASNSKEYSELAKESAISAKEDAESVKNDVETVKNFANLKLKIEEIPDVYRYIFKLIFADGSVLSNAEIDLPLETSIIRIDDKIITNDSGEEVLGLRFYLQNGDVVPGEHDEKYPDGYYPVDKILNGFVHASVPDNNYYNVYGQRGSVEEIKAATLYALKEDAETPNADCLVLRGSRGEIYTVLNPQNDYEATSKKFVDELVKSYSLDIDAVETNTGYTVTIYSEHSSKTIYLKNGNDGYTPQKYVDYFTPEDISHIATEAAAKVDLTDIDTRIDNLNTTKVSIINAINGVMQPNIPGKVNWNLWDMFVYAYSPNIKENGELKFGGSPKLWKMSSGWNPDNKSSTEAMTIVLRTKTGTITAADPTDAHDVTTKQYVDNIVGDISAAFDELHAYAQSLVNGV